MPTGSVAAMSLGVYHSLFLDSSGTISCAGDDQASYGCSSVNHSGSYSELISGYHHAYGLDDFGNVTVFNNGKDPGTRVSVISAFGITKDYVGVDIDGQFIHSLSVFDLDD